MFLRAINLLFAYGSVYGWNDFPRGRNISDDYILEFSELLLWIRATWQTCDNGKVPAGGREFVIQIVSFVEAWLQ